MMCPVISSVLVFVSIAKSDATEASSVIEPRFKWWLSHLEFIHPMEHILQKSTREFSVKS